MSRLDYDLDDFIEETGYGVRHTHQYTSDELLVDTDHGSYFVGSSGARKVRLC